MNAPSEQQEDLPVAKPKAKPKGPRIIMNISGNSLF
jgi:hypothetical protein